MDCVPNTFFEVIFEGGTIGMSGVFGSVSGLGMEFEYETYSEGGSNYPRQFFKNAVPQTLVLKQGTVTTSDSFMQWMQVLNQGIAKTLNGIVMLKDPTGEVKRTWVVQGAFLTKYIGPELSGTEAALAVTQIEMLHNGCF